jgi:hypothetical protein
MTDSKFDVVGTRKGVSLTKGLIGSIIEIHRSKNWAFDLKHDFLFSEKVSEIPLSVFLFKCRSFCLRGSAIRRAHPSLFAH